MNATFGGTLNADIGELVELVLPSLVLVQGRRWGAGAGIVWDADGLILTNNHVVGRRAPSVHLHDAREYAARIVRRDPDRDLALLSIDARARGRSRLRATRPEWVSWCSHSATLGGKETP